MTQQLNKPEYRQYRTKSASDRIRRRIERADPGALFVVRDFLDIAAPDTVTRMLSRLAAQGLIQRVEHGVYLYPRSSALLKKTVPPDPAQVGAAMARRLGQEVSPSEAQIANALGLSTQVPAKTILRTNGTKTRKGRVGNSIVELRPTAARYFPGNFSESVLQGLRFMGEGNVTDAMIERLRTLLDNRQKAALRRKIPAAPAWMYPLLHRIVAPDTQAIIEKENQEKSA